MTEEQIAKFFGVGKSSFERHKAEHPELRQALIDGRKTLVEQLKDSLKKKALGFEYTERKTVVRQIGESKVRIVEEYQRYSPPDTGAIHLLLKNLDESWRNDDRETMDLKKQKIELEKQKAEMENW